jgi:hypothetical protein
MNPHYFFRQWLNFITFAKHLEDANVRVVGAEDVTTTIITFWKWRNQLWGDVARKAARQVGIELFIKILDFISEIAAL